MSIDDELIQKSGKNSAIYSTDIFDHIDVELAAKSSTKPCGEKGANVRQAKHHSS